MSLRPFFTLQIQQITPYSYIDDTGAFTIVDRTRLITIDFVCEYKIESGYESHTNTAELSFPKNIQLERRLNNGEELLFVQSTTYNVILGGTTNQNSDGEYLRYAPLLMRGDIIYIQDGYFFRNENGKDIQVGNTVFSGYVSKIMSDTPIRIECEDNFYLLKRTPFDSDVWNKTSSNGNTDLYSLMKRIIDLVNKQFSGNSRYNTLSGGVNPYPILEFTEIPNSISAEFSLGYLDIGDLTCAQVLDKLKNQYHFESTFSGNSLYFGVTIYNDSEEYKQRNPEQSSYFFYFNDLYKDGKLIASANILDDCNLQYVNKEDIVLSAIVHCKTKKVDENRRTRDGQSATVLSKLKIMVYWDIVTSSFKYINLSDPGTVTPRNVDGGERHDFIYPIDINKPAPSLTQLFNFGVEHLKKYFYTGFKGSFKTIGYPIVDWNYNVNIIDPILSDRNGQYKVKKVIRNGGYGIEQEIFLDYKINVAIPNNLQTIYMI